MRQPFRFITGKLIYNFYNDKNPIIALTISSISLMIFSLGVSIVTDPSISLIP
jgi:hypothetical protein